MIYDTIILLCYMSYTYNDLWTTLYYFTIILLVILCYTYKKKKKEIQSSKIRKNIAKNLHPFYNLISHRKYRESNSKK